MDASDRATRPVRSAENGSHKHIGNGWRWTVPARVVYGDKETPDRTWGTGVIELERPPPVTPSLR